MKKEDRVKLFEAKQYAEQSFDKQLVSLSGGGLVLTIGFVKEIVDLSKAEWLPLLLLCWICFALTLTINLISHKATLKIVDNYLKDDYDKGEAWNRRTDILNGVTIALFLFAVSFFIIFVIKNI